MDSLLSEEPISFAFKHNCPQMTHYSPIQPATRWFPVPSDTLVTMRTFDLIKILGDFFAITLLVWQESINNFSDAIYFNTSFS